MDERLTPGAVGSEGRRLRALIIGCAAVPWLLLVAWLAWRYAGSRPG